MTLLSDHVHTWLQDWKLQIKVPFLKCVCVGSQSEDNWRRFTSSSKRLLHFWETKYGRRKMSLISKISCLWGRTRRSFTWKSNMFHLFPPPLTDWKKVVSGSAQSFVSFCDIFFLIIIYFSKMSIKVKVLSRRPLIYLSFTLPGTHATTFHRCSF